jgi:hypothetical protein
MRKGLLGRAGTNLALCLISQRVVRLRNIIMGTSYGSVLCCDSISDTDIINCNSKFWRSSNGTVGDNEWIEGVDEIKRRDKCFFLKVDFEKAYDSVSWSYLEYMLRRMNFEFEDKSISWMSTCFRSNSISVLVNGMGV